MEAALALFEERGYDRTTVSDIAARAQLADRTFFRYFSDKPEVLFSGAAEFEQVIADAIANVPATAAPLEVVVAAATATSPMLEARRPFARRRQALIAAHAELHERELIKFTRIAATLAGNLRGRGLARRTADLYAQTGMTVFQNAFERWIDDTNKRHDLAHHVHASLGELRLLTGGTATARRRGRPG